VLVAQGNLPEALKSFRDSLAVMDRLAKAAPGNAVWQRDFIVSCVRLAAADQPEARTYWTRALKIAQQMQQRGQLAPRDLWILDDLPKRIAASPK
jgi:hypothetical protein